LALDNYRADYLQAHLEPGRVSFSRNQFNENSLTSFGLDKTFIFRAFSKDRPQFLIFWNSNVEMIKDVFGQSLLERDKIYIGAFCTIF
jgi:hypothetical protein